MNRIVYVGIFYVCFFDAITSKQIVRIAVHERLSVNYVNKSYGYAQIYVRKINRTMLASNITLQLARDVEPDAYLDVKIMKWDNGIYKETAIQFHKTVCEFLHTDYVKLFGPFIKDGYLMHFVKECPIKKGYYYMRNAGIPTTNFPYLPLWRVRSSIIITRAGYKLIDVDSFVSVQEKVVD